MVAVILAICFLALLRGAGIMSVPMRGVTWVDGLAEHVNPRRPPANRSGVLLLVSSRKSKQHIHPVLDSNPRRRYDGHPRSSRDMAQKGSQGQQVFVSLAQPEVPWLTDDVAPARQECDVDEFPLDPHAPGAM